MGGSLYTYPSLDSINWPVLILSVIFLLIVIFVCVKIYFYKPATKKEELIVSSDKGLGGWLLFVAFGLILAPFSGIPDMVEYGSAIYSTNTWSTLLNPMDADFHPLKAPYLLSFLFAIVAEEMFTILLIFLFFKKKRLFPILFISVTWVTLIVLLFYEWSGSILLKESLTGMPVLIGLFWHALIWTTYLLRSKRVKATFVNE